MAARRIDSRSGSFENGSSTLGSTLWLSWARTDAFIVSGSRKPVAVASAGMAVSREPGKSGEAAAHRSSRERRIDRPSQLENRVLRGASTIDAQWLVPVLGGLEGQVKRNLGSECASEVAHGHGQIAALANHIGDIANAFTQSHAPEDLDASIEILD